MIHRYLTDSISKRLDQGKAILLIGPRQVGKTTLLRQMIEAADQPGLWLNCDEPDVRAHLNNATSTKLKALIGPHHLVAIDEAQRVTNIGLTIKLLLENCPRVQVLVTGSSALELTSEVKEPLTGRKFEYAMYPLSFGELVDHHGLLTEQRLLTTRLIYGTYPEIVTAQGNGAELLGLLADSYLYRDLFTMGQIKRPQILEKLLQALALQIGGEVSTSELGQLIGSDRGTVERYMDLLERAYVIFRLPSLNRNRRNEIKKGRKVYFYDNGIRNAIINNFAVAELRNDMGALWENFLITERIKANARHGRRTNFFFWRTHNQQEVDYIEEYDGRLHAYEFKWNPHRKVRLPRAFLNSYPDSATAVITPENASEFLL